MRERTICRLHKSDGVTPQEVMCEVRTEAGSFLFSVVHHPHNEIQIMIDQDGVPLWDYSPEYA